METEKQRETQQKLHRELMILKADYDDLLKRLADWHKLFAELYEMSDESMNSE